MIPPSDVSALLRVAQMQAADRLTEVLGTSGEELMQNAGAAVAREAMSRWSARPVVVLCGPGNNGGDGFVVANVLAAAGWPVRVALLGAVGRLQGDAARHAARWPGPVEPLDARVLDGAELIVDALFGAGLSRPLEADVTRLLEAAGGRGIPLVAVDVPSGLMGDTGESFGAARAQLTVTFTRKKPAHVLMPGRELCGTVVRADIGTPPSVLARIDIDTWENDPRLWRQRLPQLHPAANNTERAHPWGVGCSPPPGAARRAGRAAARMGAGLTTIAVPERGLDVYAAALTSIMVRPLARAQELSGLLGDPRFTACLIGPGAGVDGHTRDQALAMLGSGRPVVLDADALTVFAREPQHLFRAIQAPCVLTPHAGEFARLFDPSGDKLLRARRAARESGAVIVLKGADTVIAAPDGRAIVNANAPPTLATGGSGDVLGGMILGLLSQGMEAYPAAAAAVWMHGAAAREFGPGLLAEDLPDLLPGVLRRLA